MFTVVVAMLIFIVWDYFGISLGIFFHGGSQYTLPLRLAPEFPLEELFFLFLLTYSTLIIYHGVQLWRSRI
jgi:lycopene cyclase domain-containing protein